jgi:glycosyltransferase involved in cell wall biosynthesis
MEYLIRAIPKVNQRFPATKFIIVGDGWLREHLESLAQSTGYPKNTTFTGFIPDEEVLALMTSADVLVVPSIYEPFGIVALEGMAAGAPVVASQIGGLGEVIEHDRTGIFVHPRNPDSIAWGVNRVLSDPDHSTWLAQNAKELVQKTYSWDAIATKTVEVYERVTG